MQNSNFRLQQNGNEPFYIGLHIQQKLVFRFVIDRIVVRPFRPDGTRAVTNINKPLKYGVWNRDIDYYPGRLTYTQNESLCFPHQFNSILITKTREHGFHIDPLCIAEKTLHGDVRLWPETGPSVWLSVRTCCRHDKSRGR